MVRNLGARYLLVLVLILALCFCPVSGQTTYTCCRYAVNDGCRSCDGDTVTDPSHCNYNDVAAENDQTGECLDTGTSKIAITMQSPR